MLTVLGVVEGRQGRGDLGLPDVSLLFRAVNERIRELANGWSYREHNFVCECADQGCTGLLVMTAQEYEQLRRHPGRFAVLHGHQQAGDELVENRAGFIVVAPAAAGETRGGAPDPAVA